MLQNIETEWISKASKGDHYAFENIYRRYNKTVYGFALRMVNNINDAEDVMQMTFIKLYKGLPGFREASKLSTYILSICRNCCFDLLKKRKKESGSPLPDSEEMPVIDLTDLNQAIRQLPERMRACFVLFAVEGYTQNEISDIMDIETGTVKAMIFQARKKLHRFFEMEERS